MAARAQSCSVHYVCCLVSLACASCAAVSMCMAPSAGAADLPAAIAVKSPARRTRTSATRGNRSVYATGGLAWTYRSQPSRPARYAPSRVAPAMDILAVHGQSTFVDQGYPFLARQASCSHT